MPKQTTDLKNEIQEWNNLLKTGYHPRDIMWKDFWGTLWASIKYVLLVTTLSNSESSKLPVSLYRDTVSRIGAVKYFPLAFQYGHPKYQGLEFPRIGIEQKISQKWFFSKHIYYESPG